MLIFIFHCSDEAYAWSCFDGDDKWDAQVYDKDGDEFPEYWLIDRNGNGELDNPAIDTDKDGYPDYFL